MQHGFARLDDFPCCPFFRRVWLILVLLAISGEERGNIVQYRCVGLITFSPPGYGHCRWDERRCYNRDGRRDAADTGRGLALSLRPSILANICCFDDTSLLYQVTSYCVGDGRLCAPESRRLTDLPPQNTARTATSPAFRLSPLR